MPSSVDFKKSFILGFLFFIGLVLPCVAQVNKNNYSTTKEYIDAIKYYRYLNPDSALILVKEGIDFAILKQDELGHAALLNQYGMIEDNATRDKQSREKYLQAEAIYRKHNDQAGLAATLVRLGVVEKRKGNLDKALKYFFNALKINEQIKHKIGILECNVTISEAYFALGDTDRTLAYLLIAEKIDSEIPVSNFSFNMYISFGYLYIELGEYDKAITYINTGLSKIKKVEYNGSKAGLLKLLGAAYDKKGDKKLAVKYFLQALELTREIKNVLREQATLIELSDVYATIEPQKALAYLQQSLKITETQKLYKQQIITLNKISDSYRNKGNYEQALLYKDKSYRLAEEVFYKDMANQIANLEAAYELEKTNLEISELKLKNSQTQMTKNVLLSIVIATSILSIIALIFYSRTKKLNKLLKNANLNLAESNDQKDKFFSIVAHDIRSPLVSTVSIMKLIGSGDLDHATQLEVVNKLAIHSESSLEILDKLLKWGQMQIKGVRINITNFNALKAITNNFNLLKEAAEKKNIEVHLAIDEDITLKGDSDHFEFVIRNLLANAIKFTANDGNIWVSANVFTDNFIKFSVKDTGVGISEVRLQKLFQLSATGTKGTSNEEGTSLGLVICKQFIEANKGELTVVSELNYGTTFEFTFPKS